MAQLNITLIMDMVFAIIRMNKENYVHSWLFQVCAH